MTILAMEALRTLSVAAASGRVGYVFLVGDKLKDWRVSGKAAKSSSNAAAEVQKWINQLNPGVVVTERLEDAARKGDKTKFLIAAIANIASHNYVLDVAVTRRQDYANKYAEAEALAERFPEIRSWCPKHRQFFDKEPRNTVLFEALSLAEEVRKGGSAQLGAALG